MQNDFSSISIWNIGSLPTFAAAFWLSKEAPLLLYRARITLACNCKLDGRDAGKGPAGSLSNREKATGTEWRGFAVIYPTGKTLTLSTPICHYTGHVKIKHTFTR